MLLIFQKTERTEAGVQINDQINPDIAHGEVFAAFLNDYDLQNGETTVTAADGIINVRELPKTITLSAVPEYGYELTGWSVEACDPVTGEPYPQGWTLPVELVCGADRFEIATAGTYSFRISAAFAEQAGYPVSDVPGQR